MYILHRRIYSSDDFFLKMWLIAGAVILAVAAVLMWNDRFRESFETSTARISVFGVESEGKRVENFTGSRGFFEKMNKLGLPGSVRKAELAELFAELTDAGTLAYGESSVPVLWIFAEGLTKDDRDRSVQTFGKTFFDRQKFSFEIVDARGFSMQLDPDTFRVLWAKDGGAICALPLLILPGDTYENGFVFRVEERGADGAWKVCGNVKIGAFEPPATEFSEALTDAGPTEVAESGDSDFSEIAPSVSVKSFELPKICRFFSAELWNREAFGELKIAVEANASGRVPAAAWTLENFGIFAFDENSCQAFPLTRADAFHKGVRFLEDEIFENFSDGILSVPAAKACFPANFGADENLPWLVKMRFVRTLYFPEDLHKLEPLRVGKNSSVLSETVSAKNSSAKIRAFRDENYFRRRNEKIPAVVLEIEQSADADFYWAPERVRTDAGEELFAESYVNVRPGVKQYWFIPRRSAPAKIEVVCAVTRVLFRTDTVVPVVREK